MKEECTFGFAKGERETTATLRRLVLPLALLSLSSLRDGTFVVVAAAAAVTAAVTTVSASSAASCAAFVGLSRDAWRRRWSETATATSSSGPQQHVRRMAAARMSSSGGGDGSGGDGSGGGDGELDHIFGRGWERASPSLSSSSSLSSSPLPLSLSLSRTTATARAVLRVPDGSPAVTLASSITAPRTTTDVGGAEGWDDDDEAGQDGASAAPTTATATDDGAEGIASFRASRAEDVLEDEDPYVLELLRKKQLKQVRVSPFHPGSFFEGKDFTDIFFTVVVPLGAAAYGTRWLYDRSARRMADAADGGLHDYAGEMCYHTGDFDELNLCHSDYKKRLAWLGPSKTDRMLKAFLETFAKKVTISPRSISSLSYVFSLYKLSEDKAAQILSDLCLSMPEKTASTGKLLFYGSRVLKSTEAKAKLEPIRNMLASSYREDVGVSGEVIVEKSQFAMAEAAYREAVNAAGKNQSSITPGWEVLGLDRDDAKRIFEEEEERGFVSSKEAKYSRAKLKYDSKGRRIDENGKVVVGDGENGGSTTGDDGMQNEETKEKKDEEEPTSNVYECGECGYTLFVAEGRNAKFFGSGFTCPECGAAKEKFVGRTMGED